MMIDVNAIQVPVAAISRHRLMTDGDGVTTLVVLHSCPLRCRWCLNPQTWREGSTYQMMTPMQLYTHVRVDDLYFQATGGGITFGGGEPAIRSLFISQFRKVIPKQWKINIETSLNVPHEHVEQLIPIVDEFVIDIKDMNPQIYEAYTSKDNTKTIANLKMIASSGIADKCLIRIPLIPGFNSEEDRERSMQQLRQMGFTRFDKFEYKTDINR